MKLSRMQTVMNPSGRRGDFQHRLNETNQKLKAQKDLVASLEKERTDAITRGDAEAALETNVRLLLAQEGIPDLEITKKALESRLRIFQKNETEAATIRETIHARWEQIRPLVDALIVKRDEVAKIMEQITPLQTEIQSLAPQYMNLLGEELEPPILQLPSEVHRFSAIILQPVASWRFMSEADRRAAAAKKAAQEEADQERRIELAIQQAPICEECGVKMELRNDAWGRRTEKAGYRCAECGRLAPPAGETVAGSQLE
jgi:hypothetical protein